MLPAAHLVGVVLAAESASRPAAAQIPSDCGGISTATHSRSARPKFPHSLES